MRPRLTGPRRRTRPADGREGSHRPPRGRRRSRCRGRATRRQDPHRSASGSAGCSRHPPRRRPGPPTASRRRRSRMPRTPVPASSTRSTAASAGTVRFGRDRAGARCVSAVLIRTRHAPYEESARPLGAPVGCGRRPAGDRRRRQSPGQRAAAATARRATDGTPGPGHLARATRRRKSPSASTEPKVGSSSANDQPGLPAAAQLSKSAGQPRIRNAAFVAEQPPTNLPRGKGTGRPTAVSSDA
jgi:hypothetical protein